MILFFLLLKLLFPSPVFLLFSLLLASNDQLCHAKNSRFVYKFKNIDIAAFSADIGYSMLCAGAHYENTDALSDCFNTTLTDILDKHAPLKTRTTTTVSKR